MTLQFLRCSSFSNILVILPFLFLMLSQFFQKHISYNNTTHHYLQILTNSLSCPYLVFSLSNCCYCLMEDHSEYNITTYVLAIHYHILNSQNNGKFLHIYHPIWHMPTYLHGYHMFQHYLNMSQALICQQQICRACLLYINMTYTQMYWQTLNITIDMWQLLIVLDI